MVVPMQIYKVCLQAPHFIYSQPDKIRRHAKNLLVRATLFCPWHFFHYLCRLIMMNVQYKPLPILQVRWLRYKILVTYFVNISSRLSFPSKWSRKSFIWVRDSNLCCIFQNRWLWVTMVLLATTPLYPATWWPPPPSQCWTACWSTPWWRMSLRI